MERVNNANAVHKIRTLLKRNVQFQEQMGLVVIETNKFLLAGSRLSG